MSDLLKHERAQNRQGRLRKHRAKPKEVIVKANQPSVIMFTDDSHGTGTCLGCHDAPCIELRKEQLVIKGILEEFPGDPSVDVCPTDAISWNEAGDAPKIDEKMCIGCGLCVALCPYGAISLLPEGVARVEGHDPDGIAHSEPGAAHHHPPTPRIGAVGNASTPFLSELPGVVNKLTDIQRARLVRNMFVACGITANVRRKGDTNIRMEGVLHFESGQVGVLELETSSAVLESPRALLEDIAVLHGRFGVAKKDLVPISVLGALPNSRSEYYQVIDDIERVLGFRCRTLSLGALCLIVWNFTNIHEFYGELFSTHQDATDLRSSVIELIGDEGVQEPHPGAFTPPK